MQHLQSQVPLNEMEDRLHDLVVAKFGLIWDVFARAMIKLVYREPVEGSDGSVMGRFIANERISSLLNLVAHDNEGRPLLLWGRRKGDLMKQEEQRVARLNRGKPKVEHVPPRLHWGNQKLVLGFKALAPQHFETHKGLVYKYLAFHLGTPKPGRQYAYKFLSDDHLDSLGLMWLPSHNPRKNARRARRVAVDEQGMMLRTKRQRPRFEDSPLLTPVMVTPDEITELEILMLITEHAERDGVIAQRAMTLRDDGSLEQGLLPHGRVDAEDISNLYQFAHKGDDVSQLKALATIEQHRTRREDESDEYVDGTDRADDAEFGPELFAGHTGYNGLVPIHRNTEEENKDMARPIYRIDELIELYRFSKAGPLERVTYMDELENVHDACLRTKEFHAWDMSLVRKGDRTRKGVVCYGPEKDIEEVYEPHYSIVEELEGLIRNAVEEGRFLGTLLQRTSVDKKGKQQLAGRKRREWTWVHQSLVSHKLLRPKHNCQRCGKWHHFTRLPYADVCPFCGNEYFHVRMQVLIRADLLGPAFKLDGVDVVGVYVYGRLVGEYLKHFPIVKGKSKAFKGKVLHSLVSV